MRNPLRGNLVCFVFKFSERHPSYSRNILIPLCLKLETSADAQIAIICYYVLITNHDYLLFDMTLS